MNPKYRMFNAPSAETIDRAANLEMNWAIVHSAGIEEGLVDPATGRPRDMFPLYFDAYPKVAAVRRGLDAGWIEPMRREVRALCERADALGLNCAFHMYEPTLPHVFEREYPEIVSVFKRTTEAGTVDIHSHMDPDNPETWKLVTSKYAELAREFPLVKMVILTTWDGAGSRWCLAKAKMPIAKRLVRMVEAATAGVRSVRKDVTVVLRLWGRNWPARVYRDRNRMINEIAGIDSADEVMEPTVRPYNDPDVVLPAVFKDLAPDVPVMYKSTQFDISDAQPLTETLGKYPKTREQILEVSYELYHLKPWSWCKVAHLRKGLDAVRKHKLAGFLALPINMGNNLRDAQPEKGNLGRMNTWLLKRLLKDDKRTDAGLVAAWLEKEFDGPQPKEAVDVLLEADAIVGDGIQWGNGGTDCLHAQFTSLHTMKLYWINDGFIDGKFADRMLKPTREFLEELIEMKRSAEERARRNIERIKAARAAMSPALCDELLKGYATLADYILLIRLWHSHHVMQYGIEKGVFEADRPTLDRASRYVEEFIRAFDRLRDTDAGRRAAGQFAFPDPFIVP